MTHNITRRNAIGAALGATLALPAIRRAQSAGPVKIGLITTLSGPGGYPGQDIRDGFKLAMAGGTLGGVPVQLLVEDDALKPSDAKQIASRFYKSEKVRLFTGIAFSNVLLAVVPDLLDGGAIYVGANAAPSTLAGKDCNPNYWVVSWQNDTLHEAAGANANKLGHQRMYVLAPNYQAGKDAITGFKRVFKGQIVGEAYTRLDQTDFAPEMALIRAAAPDAVFQFHPGGLGIAFIRQYQQAGLAGKIPMVVSAPSLDSVTLAAVGDAARGMNVTSQWNADFANQANKDFVAAFLHAYHRLPTFYASQGYDTGLAIGAALHGSGGDVTDTAKFRAAMQPANFASVRGKFRFGNNQSPVQDWYGLVVQPGADGKLALVTQDRVLTDYGDAYAALCKM